MRGTVIFTLNGKLVEVQNPDPTQNALRWLRERGLTGTKEGCAEGDCGACTIAINDQPGGKWRAVNACILFLPMLDGCALVTVEGVAGKDGTLHPVQQAMIDHHASQCGFCTPGFVMSLYAHYRNHGPVDDDSLNDALAGNLCRCTGYAPIIRAGKAMYDYPTPAQEDTVLPQTTGTLHIRYDDPVHGLQKEYFAPRTVDQLADLVRQNPKARIVAGNTDLGLWVNKLHRVLPALIDVGKVAGFDTISDEGTHIRINAGARYAQALKTLGDLYPPLGEMMRRIGSTQIRNGGTIGGNIANGSPIGDMPPALIALGAKLTLRKGSEQRTIALQDFFIAYGQQDRKSGEFIESVDIPKPENDTFFTVFKISKRFDQDISALCGAFFLAFENGKVAQARIAYGGMAGIPARAAHAQNTLIGKPFDETNVRAAMAAMADDFTPLDDMRASAQYRLDVAQNLLFKAWLAHNEKALYLPRQSALSGGRT